MTGKKGSKHAELTTLLYNGILVDAKMCNQCKIVKPLDQFYKAPKGIGMRRPKCISCMSPTGRTITQLLEIEENGDKYPAKQCKSCNKVLPLHHFHKGRGAGGKTSNCKNCISKKQSEQSKIKALERKKIPDIDDMVQFSNDDYSNIWTMKDGIPEALVTSHEYKEDVYYVTTIEGYETLIPSTYDILVIPKQSQKKQYTIWKPISDLNVGDRVALSNFRDLQPWKGNGNFDQGWLIGELLGDGGLSGTTFNAYLRFWGESQQDLTEISVVRIKSQLGARSDLTGSYGKINKAISIKSSRLTELASKFGLEHTKEITPYLEMASFEFYCGLLRGLFDADGSVQGTQDKGISVRLSQSNLPFLQKVQRMLLRLGIVSSLYTNRRDAGHRLLPDGKGGSKLYFCKANHELVIANDNIVRFWELIGFEEPEKIQRLNNAINSFKRSPNRERFTARVNNIQIQRNSVNYPNQKFPVSMDLNGILVRFR